MEAESRELKNKRSKDGGVWWWLGAAAFMGAAGAGGAASIGLEPAAISLWIGTAVMVSLCLMSKGQATELRERLMHQLEENAIRERKLISAIPEVIGSRDQETGGHVLRSGELAGMLAESLSADKNLGISPEFCRMVRAAAPIHDLGKIALPDSILRKPGKLTAAEYEKVKQHCYISAKLIDRLMEGTEDRDMLEIAENMALYHHERVDGSGYPRGLKGEEIPLEARIMALADVCDALLSRRCYKEAMPFDQVFQTIEEAMGSQFDPMLSQCLLSSRERIREYYTATRSRLTAELQQPGFPVKTENRLVGN